MKDSERECSRCGDVAMYCTCVEDLFEKMAEFTETHGREPTTDEALALQPETFLELQRQSERQRSPQPKVRRRT